METNLHRMTRLRFSRTPIGKRAAVRAALPRRTGSGQSGNCAARRHGEGLSGDAPGVSMIPPKHILLPVDFSERSVDAAREAEVLARHFRSGVTVLHVADPGESELGRFEPGGVKARELEKVLTTILPDLRSRGSCARETRRKRSSASPAQAP